MGDLQQLRGSEWRYTIRDFRGGLKLFGPAGINLGDVSDIDSMATLTCFGSYSGRLEPIVGDAAYNSTSITNISSSVDFLFPYMQPNSSGVLLLVGKSGHLYEYATSGAGTTITSAVEIGAAGVSRFGSQALGYCWIGASNTQLYRYNQGNPGSGGKLSYAGTKAPTNAPTAAVASGSGLTLGTGYSYRYGWEYGVSRELGQGWKQSSAPITPTVGNLQVTVTMDASPPSNYSHAVSRALWRNTTSYQDTWFLLTRTDYSGSALSTTYRDSSADTAIENGEICRPLVGETITAPVYSELLPPKIQFPCVHEGRLYGLDVWVGSVRYPHRVVYSDIDLIAPHFDQFYTTSNIQAISGDAGEPRGLVSWMGNLYAIFERGISVLSADPGPGRLPSFAQVVYGRGCINSLTIAVTPDGIIMLSHEGLILFQGSPNPKPLSENIWNALRGASTGAGGYNPLYREYDLSMGSSIPNVYTLQMSNGMWTDSYDTFAANTNWTYCCQVGNDLVYAYGTGNESRKVYKRKRGSLGTSLSTNFLTRKAVLQYTDFGKPMQVKYLRDIIIELNTAVASDGTSNLILYFKNDTGTVTSATRSFSATSSRSQRFVFDPSGTQFHQLSLELNLAGTDSAIRSIPVDTLTFHFIAEPLRVYSKVQS